MLPANEFVFVFVTVRHLLGVGGHFVFVFVFILDYTHDKHGNCAVS